MIDRRLFLLGTVALASAGWAIPAELSPARFERIRSRLGPGARLGVGLFDMMSERTAGFEADSRFPLGSTFKVPLVAAVLERIDRDEMTLSQQVAVAAGDIVEYAPVVRRRLRQGRMRLNDLCAAAVVDSDNSAANLLLREIGGPESFNAFVRRCGDRVTRLDRYEPELNLVDAGGERDSTTPAAMAGLVHELLAGDILSRDSRSRLSEWMQRPIRLRIRLRADLPPPSGGADRGVAAAGEIDRLYPRGQGAVIVAAYIAGGDSRPMAREAAFESVARAVAAAMPGSALPSDPPEISYPIG